MSHSPEANKPKPHIDDVPPKRSRDFADLTHAFFALVLGIGVILFSVYLHGTASGVESDVRSAGRVVSWLMDVPSSLLQQLAIVCITVSVLIQLLASKEWLQSVVSVVSLIFGFFAVWGVSALISNSGNAMLIIPLQSNSTSVGTGLLPDFYAAMASFLTVSGPRRIRSCTKWGWNVLYAVAMLMVVLSWNSLAGAIASYAIGRVIGMLIRFAIGTQNNGAWGTQIEQSLRSIGIDVSLLTRRVAPYADSGVLKATLDDDLIENSRIYDVVDYEGTQYTVSVLDNQVHAAGYLNQVWQWLRLTGVSMRRDRSSVDAMHHHYAMILGLSNAGLETPNVYGVADYGESSILVFHRNHMPLECNQNTMSDHDMEAFMEYLTAAHHHGFTHRRITPDTLSRMENNQPVIAGWQNGDYGSASPNFSLDKVQLLVLLATLNGVDRAVACARRTWGDEQLINLAPFVQKAAVPAATRALPGWDKKTLADLRTRISALAPQDVADSMEKVTLSRFSFRSFFAIALLVIAVYVVFTQIQPAEMIEAVRDANLAMALVCVALGFIAWLGSAITLGVFMDSDKRNTIGLYCSQMASGFTAVSMPAGVGPAFVNLQYRCDGGYERGLGRAGRHYHRAAADDWSVHGAQHLVRHDSDEYADHGDRPRRAGRVGGHDDSAGTSFGDREISSDGKGLRTQSSRCSRTPEGTGFRYSGRIGPQSCDRTGLLGRVDGIWISHESHRDHVHLPACQHIGFRGSHTWWPRCRGSRAVGSVHRRGHPLHHCRFRYSRLPNRLLLAANSGRRTGYEMARQAQFNLTNAPVRFDFPLFSKKAPKALIKCRFPHNSALIS